MIHGRTTPKNPSYQWPLRLAEGSRIYPFIIAILAIIACQTATCNRLAWAGNSDLKLKISRDGRSLEIVSVQADIKAVLAELSQAANLAISYPTTLEKKITLNRAGLSIGETLEVVLRGINHVILYSGPSRKTARIKKVFVLNKKARRRPISRHKERQLNRRIQTYRHRINSLKRRLADMEPTSPQGRRYQNRISRLKRTLERLEQQSY